MSSSESESVDTPQDLIDFLNDLAPETQNVLQLDEEAIHQLYTQTNIMDVFNVLHLPYDILRYTAMNIGSISIEPCPDPTLEDLTKKTDVLSW